MTTAAISLDALREHIITANYPAATETFCALLNQGQPLDALVREARRLGLVKPGERLFIVKGISAWVHDKARLRPGGR